MNSDARTRKSFKYRSQRAIKKDRRRHQRKVLAAVRHDYRELVDESLMDAAGEPVAARADELGLAITVSTNGKDQSTRTLQFGIWRDGWRVADYWPTSFTLKIGYITTKAAALPDALEAVALAVGPTTSTGPHGPRKRGRSRGRHYQRPQGAADRQTRRY